MFQQIIANEAMFLVNNLVVCNNKQTEFLSGCVKEKVADN